MNPLSNFSNDPYVASLDPRAASPPLFCSKSTISP